MFQRKEKKKNNFQNIWNEFPITNPNTIPNTMFVATSFYFLNQYIQVFVWQGPEHQPEHKMFL